MGGHGHPYSPAELELPGFVPQRLSQGQILAPFVGTAVFSVLGAWLISGRCRGGGRLSRTDRLLMGWWLFAALTYIVLESPFLFTPDFLSKENPNYFDELFKEYSKGDSRFAARNSTVLALEVVTIVLEGPAALLAAYAIASRKSYSHILQFAVSLAQLYGRLLYFITAYLDGFNFWVSPYYFWAYFIGSNSSWVIIPTLVATRSWKKISAAFQAEKIKTR
ncbi:probable 3-beta-hydroxysteroid-Delta(8),Delta(7)-isomerase isoform X2 [Sorghum bicolor]|uniref:probable 3-beta-hydroxysteroid-Delta(8),Delta(7)-isomerase isoform X2 n=1 Tax=Sorghum bicolor TaxID=4558 RepID=UPI000B424774|nr:probable 3-beta-hydroxysteroid-Delta(8),Delta(7)-isomerase isoform X2 [Sorghum bicolor]|eukprot:XP_021311449.1 probable 3-beta-hydroxysteroid-Delta(8),Delta(7)-isomerase isoform X2 [Sorghum bicolor]